MSDPMSYGIPWGVSVSLPYSYKAVPYIWAVFNYHMIKNYCGSSSSSGGGGGGGGGAVRMHGRQRANKPTTRWPALIPMPCGGKDL
jgi:hypothetical protein